MKVLVACEFSGIVREAFAKRGHNAWSCDFLPTEIPGKHIQTAMQHIDYGYWKWDLVIAFPPCTHLSKAGGWAWKYKAREQRSAIDFVLWIADLPVHRIAIENPVGALSTYWRKPDQIIHPYYFGDPWLKETCLWLKNLPLLTYVLNDDMFDKATAVDPQGNWVKPGNKRSRRFNDVPEGGNRNPKDRSRAFNGIADAMAEQWGEE